MRKAHSRPWQHCLEAFDDCPHERRVGAVARAVKGVHCPKVGNDDRRPRGLLRYCRPLGPERWKHELAVLIFAPHLKVAHVHARGGIEGRVGAVWVKV